MNCGICRDGFSVNVKDKFLCVLVDRKAQKINSSIFFCAGLN
jgi:hypothetical protein